MTAIEEEDRMQREAVVKKFDKVKQDKLADY